MARILVSGASGFIGKPLVSFLNSTGYSVFQLVRSSAISTPNSIFWNPEAGEANEKDFEDFEAVIHLAGEPLTLSRWSNEKRKKILQSRTTGTMFLSHLLSAVRNPPRLFVSASAIGYYGDRGEEILNEESGPGSGFLSHVCCAWEKGSFAIHVKGSRVVQARFGMVLGSNGGALQKMLTAYRFGLGGKLGSGRQWVSWVHREDLIQSIFHIIKNESLKGPVNIVSPCPVRQEDFSSTLASLLHRPHFFKVPAWALRLALGVMAKEMILASTRVDCAKLLASNFSFIYPDLRSALYQALQT
jgi:uncharacterized protein (TIGR01777 family)